MCALATSYWHLVLARIGVGIGEAGTNPASHSIIADLYPLERRSFAMGIFAMGPHLGILTGFVIGGFVGEAFGWRAPFLVAGIAGLAMTALCVYIVKEPGRTPTQAAIDKAPAAAVFAAARPVWRQRSLRHLFIGGTVLEVGVSGLVAWLPAFLMRAHDLSLSTTGALLAFVLGALGAAGTLLGGWTADRLGARDPAWRLRAPAVVMIMAALVWALALTADNDATALVALMLAGALISFHLGPTFAMVQSLTAPHMRALTASLLLFVANLVGVGVGPYVVGALSDATVAEQGANSLRLGLLIVPPLFLWAAVHFNLAARALATDLSNASADASHAAVGDVGAQFR